MNVKVANDSGAKENKTSGKQLESKNRKVAIMN